MVSITPFGGCGLHNPLSAFDNERRKAGLPKTGVPYPPFSLSANTNHQLIDFLSGELEIPEWIVTLAYYAGFSRPPPEQVKQMFSGDVALVEMSTPTEFIYQDVLLNINRFEEVILPNIADFGSQRKVMTRWKGALRRANEELRREMAEEIYRSIPKDTPEREGVANFVRETTSRMLTVDDMTRSLGDLRDRLGVPVGLVLHNANYMPDGRPVPWPADFKDNCIEVARRLNIATLDFAPYVQSEGASKVMAGDLRHWNPKYFGRLGEHMYAFCESVADGRIGFTPPPPSASPPELDKTATAPLPFRDEKPQPPRPAAPRRYGFDPITGGGLPIDDDTITAVIVLGGAWANGANTDVEDKAASTAPEHLGKALMLDSGVRPRGREAHAFADLRERGGGSAKETPCAGLADQIMRNCQARFGDKPTMVFFTVSRGGTSLSGGGMTEEDGLLRGSAQHRELVRLVAQAREIAADRGKRLEVAAICLLHGEFESSRNVPGSFYRRGLSLLQLQYDADIRALTGQADPVRVYLTQTNRVSGRFDLSIPMAQLNVKFDNPYLQCVGPVYFAPPEVREGGPPAYVAAFGYRRIGQLFGRFLMDDLWGGQREPLRVEEARWIGPKTIRLRFNSPIALEEDDARVNISELGPGRGVDFSDGAPWSPTVESVQPARGRDFELDVELTAPSTGYAKRVLIAARPTGRGGVGCLEGARSAIRSKVPFDTDPLDGTELFDWACTEQIALP
jgi:hypothetical protein